MNVSQCCRFGTVRQTSCEKTHSANRSSQIPTNLLLRLALSVRHNRAAGSGETDLLPDWPIGSGKIITVTQVLIHVASTTNVVFTLAHGLLTSSNGFGEFRDSRNSPGAPSAAVGNTRIQTGATVNPGFELRVGSGGSFSLRDNNDIAVLLPGDQLTVAIATVQQTLTVAYFWRERPAEQSELKV